MAWSRFSANVKTMRWAALLLGSIPYCSVPVSLLAWIFCNEFYRERLIYDVISKLIVFHSHEIIFISWTLTAKLVVHNIHNRVNYNGFALVCLPAYLYNFFDSVSHHEIVALISIEQLVSNMNKVKVSIRCVSDTLCRFF